MPYLDFGVFLFPLSLIQKHLKLHFLTEFEFDKVWTLFIKTKITKDIISNKLFIFSDHDDNLQIRYWRIQCGHEGIISTQKSVPQGRRLYSNSESYLLAHSKSTEMSKHLWKQPLEMQAMQAASYFWILWIKWCTV